MDKLTVSNYENNKSFIVDQLNKGLCIILIGRGNYSQILRPAWWLCRFVMENWGKVQKIYHDTLLLGDDECYYDFLVHAHAFISCCLARRAISHFDALNTFMSKVIYPCLAGYLRAFEFGNAFTAHIQY